MSNVIWSIAENYFERLPDEILIYILSHIDTCSLINFCNAYPKFDYMFREQKHYCSRNLDFSKKFQLNNFLILKFIEERIRLEFVTQLNVNGLFWLPANNLRNLIKKLENLLELYAIDTKLSLREVDLKAYRFTKIRTLALNPDVTEIHKKPLESVKTLYIKMSTNIFNSIFPYCVYLFPKLEKLWIDSYLHPSCGINSFIESYLSGRNKTKLTKLVYSSYNRLNIQPYTNYINYFKSQPGSQIFCTCFEYFDNLPTLVCDNFVNSIKDKALREIWEYLDRLCCLPYGPKDARKLVFKEANLGDIYFEELNFFHNLLCCSDRLYNTTRTVLNTCQVSKLKSLCIMDCVLQDKKDSSTQRELTLMNMPDLEELEIFYCGRPRPITNPKACAQIASLNKLSRLVLQIPVYADCSFLIDVVKNCEHLTSLSITSLSQNENLNFYVIKAIKHGSVLKDFRFENYHIPINNLLDSLCCVKKLQRIYLKCKKVNEFTSTPLKTFLDNNPHLVFVYFIINDLTYANIKQVQDTLCTYSKINKAKIFYCRKNCFGRQNPVPGICYDEMIATHSRVCAVDFTKECYTF